VDFHIKPDRVDEWKKAVLNVLNSMSVKEMFVGAFLYQDAKDYRKIYEEQLPDLVASPRTFSVLKPVKNWIKE